jgi:hypothetical protein
MKPCNLKKSCKCGSSQGHIVPCTPPHAGKVVCWECGRWLKWLGRNDLQRAVKCGLVTAN